jgi:hypothetical protein
MDDNEEERFNTGMDDQVTIVRSIEYWFKYRLRYQ